MASQQAERNTTTSPSPAASLPRAARTKPPSIDARRHFSTPTRNTLLSRADRHRRFHLQRFAVHTSSAAARHKTCIRVATQLLGGFPRDAVCAVSREARVIAFEIKTLLARYWFGDRTPLPERRASGELRVAGGSRRHTYLRVGACFGRLFASSIVTVWTAHHGLVMRASRRGVLRLLPQAPHGVQRFGRRRSARPTRARCR
jgi:hypothetical protein